VTARPDEDGLFDSKGRWVPKRLIREVDTVRHELVLELVGRARRAAAELERFKRSAMADIDAFAALSAERYNAELGGAKGNLSLTSYDGQFKVVRQIQDSVAFDEGLQAAKALVDECIHEWTRDSGDEVRALIEHAFQVDKAGKISTERVFGLRRLNIAHPRWVDAMRAIGESVQVASSRAYLRFYERDAATGRYVPIDLELSTVPEGER
jgi:hypothetical protein